MRAQQQVCSSVHTTGAHFIFPNIDRTVHARENTTVSLEFLMLPMQCVVGDFKLRVDKRHKDVLLAGEYCRYVVHNGMCIPPYKMSGCSCHQEKGMFVFEKTVDRTDDASWIWWTEPSVADAKELVFDIQYAPQVWSLHSTSDGRNPDETVDQGDSLNVTCSFDEGNPPVTARLLDRHGVKMEGSIYSSAQIRYRFPAVGCQDAGLIRCEAPGASHNMTTTLLVKCPPELVRVDGIHRVGQSDSVQAGFLTRAHTTEIRDCRLFRRFQNSSGDLGTLAHVKSTWKNSSSNLTGTPPDLTLTVWLDNVRKEEEGQWRLELTNDAGTGHVDFYVHVTEGKPGTDNLTHVLITIDGNTSWYVSDDHTPFTDASGKIPCDEQAVDVTLLVGIGVGAAALIVVILIIVIERGGQRTRDFRVVGENEARPEIELQRQEVHGGDIYHEVDDECAEPQIQNVGPPLPCHRARALPSRPDDYLHPVASSALTERTGSATNALPLHNNSTGPQPLHAEADEL